MLSTQLREPAAAPGPTTGHGVQDGAHEDLAEDESPESDPLTDGADDDIPGRLHEHDLEEREAKTSSIVARAAQKKALAAQEAPHAASEEEFVQGWRPSEIRRCRIHCDGAKLEGVAADIVS